MTDYHYSKSDAYLLHKRIEYLETKIIDSLNAIEQRNTTHLHDIYYLVLQLWRPKAKASEWGKWSAEFINRGAAEFRKSLNADGYLTKGQREGN